MEQMWIRMRLQCSSVPAVWCKGSGNGGLRWGTAWRALLCQTAETGTAVWSQCSFPDWQTGHISTGLRGVFRLSTWGAVFDEQTLLPCLKAKQDDVVIVEKKEGLWHHCLLPYQLPRFSAYDVFLLHLLMWQQCLPVKHLLPLMWTGHWRGNHKGEHFFSTAGGSRQLECGQTIWEE